MFAEQNDGEFLYLIPNSLKVSHYVYDVIWCFKQIFCASFQ